MDSSRLDIRCCPIFLHDAFHPTTQRYRRRSATFSKPRQRSHGMSGKGGAEFKNMNFPNDSAHPFATLLWAYPLLPYLRDSLTPFDETVREVSRVLHFWRM